MKITTIAMLCHSINATYCLSQGDDSQPAWDEAPQWQKDSAMLGVEMHLNHPDATPEQSHESWYAQKEAEGWKYGEVKDAEKKEHPCFLPYAELPASQKAKDYLFKAVVGLMKDLPEPDEVLALSNQLVQLQSQNTQLQNNLNAFKQSLAVSQNTQQIAGSGAVSGVQVTYQGNKAEFIDHLYGSRLTFTHGQTRLVAKDLAKKLLKHPEFSVNDGNPTVDAIQPPDDTQEILNKAKTENQKTEDDVTRNLDAIDLVRQMDDKDSLNEYAMANFNQKLPKNQTVQWMQDKVVNLIDTVGVVG